MSSIIWDTDDVTQRVGQRELQRSRKSNDDGPLLPASTSSTQWDGKGTLSMSEQTVDAMVEEPKDVPPTAKGLWGP